MVTLKSLRDKLGLKDGMKVKFIEAPKDYDKSLGVRIPNTESKLYDFIQYFVKDKLILQTQFPIILKTLDKNGALWVSWPKKMSGIKTDLDEDMVRNIGLNNGLVDVKVVPIDDDWSALKFLYRTR